MYLLRRVLCKIIVISSTIFTEIEIQPKTRQCPFR
ncbi:unnamed protein product [Brassica napus]|uniref:(rape) hypothetical protein n=1 Tax=Brassica napus TaxID=3708 RepID=A0A816XMP9_BRANA|nr:unnamed protein product [Brassica napus]